MHFYIGQKIKILFIILYLLTPACIYAESNELNGCSADSESPPFLMIKDNLFSGVWPTLVQDAMKNLEKKHPKEKEFKREFKLHAMPWLRCLDEIKKGNIDLAMITSYKDDRAVYMNYPQGSKEEKVPCSATGKFQCSGYTLVTIQDKNDNFNFDGDFNKIPQPVRVTRTFSIMDDLVKKGLKIETAKYMDPLIKMLLRDKTGSAVIFTEVIDYYKKIHPNKLKIHANVILRKSYYIGISKKSVTNNEFKELLWAETTRLRNDKDYYTGLIKKFSDNLPDE